MRPCINQHKRPWVGDHCLGSCSGWLSDLDGFHSSSHPEPFGPSSNCSVVPVDAMVRFLNMNCKNILGVTSLHCFCLCSLNLTFSVLLVCPMYTSGQSLQGILYTTPVCFCFGVQYFTLHYVSFQSVLWSEDRLQTPEGHIPSQSSRLAH